MNYQYQKAGAEMYHNLRRTVREEFGSSASITALNVHNHVRGDERHCDFVAYVEVGGRIVCGHGRTENEIVEALRYNLENEYSVSAWRVEYTPSKRAMVEL